jgi:hypothetical protein
MNKTTLVGLALVSLMVGGCTPNLYVSPNGAVLAEAGGLRVKALSGRPATTVSVRTPEWGYCDILLGGSLRAKTTPTTPFATINVVRFYGYDTPDTFTLDAVCKTPGGFRATASESFRLPDEDRGRYGDRVEEDQWTIRPEDMRGQGGLLVVTLTLDERFNHCEIKKDGKVVASLSQVDYTAMVELVRDPEQDYAREAILVYRCYDHSGRVSTGMESFDLPDSRVEKTGWRVP